MLLKTKQGPSQQKFQTVSSLLGKYVSCCCFVQLSKKLDTSTYSWWIQCVYRPKLHQGAKHRNMRWSFLFLFLLPFYFCILQLSYFFNHINNYKTSDICGFIVSHPLFSCLWKSLGSDTDKYHRITCFSIYIYKHYMVSNNRYKYWFYLSQFRIVIPFSDWNFTQTLK